MIKKLFICVVSLLMLVGCKENKWLDWKVQNELWLQQNQKQAGVVTTASGLQYKIIANPTPQDAKPNITSSIICDYSLRLINGYQIDYGKNVSLNLSNTIPGFAEGCSKVNNNGDIEIYIPCYLGYDYQKYKDKDEYNAEGSGTEGTQAFIPPYSTLIYTLHICSVTGN